MAQLAKLIREKYPNDYSDMSDEELERAVLAKYPEYQDLVEPKGDMTPAPTETMSRIPMETASIVPEKKKTKKIGLLQGLAAAVDTKSMTPINMYLEQNLPRFIPQLSGEEPGLLNPNLEMNPALMKSFLPESRGITVPNEIMGAPVPEIAQNILGRAADAVYEYGVRPLISPLGLYSSLPGLNPAEHPSLDKTFPLPKPRPTPKALPAGPRFIAGSEGVADVNTQYRIPESRLRNIPEPGVTLTPEESGQMIDVGPDIAAEYGTGMGRPIPVKPIRFNKQGKTLEEIQAIDAQVEDFASKGYKVRVTDEGRKIEVSPPDTEAPLKGERGKFTGERGRTDPYLGEGTARPGEPQLPSAPPKPSRFSTLPDNFEEPKKPTITVERFDPLWEVESQRIKELLDRGSQLSKKESQELADLINKYGLNGDELNTIKNSFASPDAQIVATTPPPPLTSPLGEPVSNIMSAVRSGSKKKGKASVYVGDAPRQAALARLVNALFEARPIRGEQERLYAAERARRFAMVRDVKTTGMQGAKERLSKMKGELPKVEYEGLSLSEKDVNTLFDMIWNTPGLTEGQKLRGSTGLAKLLGVDVYGGVVPQNNELNILFEVVSQFGPDATKAFGKAVKSAMPFTRKFESNLLQVANFRKALMASYDFSAPLRQGLPLMLDFHSPINPIRKAYKDAWAPMFRAARSEENYNAIRASIRAHPDYNLADKAGLELTDILTGREEQFASSWAEKIPGVKHSQWAYNTFLNKLRIGTFGDLLDLAENMYGPNIRKDLRFATELANYINTSSGRGNLGTWAGSSEKLGFAFFSPKLMASRMQMLGSPNYYKLNPLKVTPADFTPEMNFIRRQKLKALLSVGAFGSTMATLAKLGGADVIVDPKSSDFMKIKVGDTRVDLFGGFQQYIVLYSRLISGARTSSITGRELVYGSRYGYPTKFDAITDFLINKASPEFSLFLRGLKQKGPQGEPIDWTKEQVDRSMPILLNDLWYIIQEDPSLIPILSTIPAAFGAGVQTYGRERVRPF